MSDLSELCPLFETGVFGEVTFHRLVNLTGLTTGGNALADPIITAGTQGGVFVFGREVVVTDCFIRKCLRTANGSNHTQELMRLRHRNSAGATPTAFGLATVTTTSSVYTQHTWWPMTLTDTTFTANAVLDFSHTTLSETAVGSYDLIVQYKEA